MKKKLADPNAHQSRTLLASGNAALRAGNYSDAVKFYEQALKNTPALETVISSNISFAKSKLGTSDGRVDQSGVTALVESKGHPQQEIATRSHRKDKVAIVVHYFYAEIWREIKDKLTGLTSQFDLFVTVPIEKAELASRDVLSAFPKARMHVGPNIGMDIVPFLSLIPVLANEDYFAVCKLQTKKGDGDLAVVWRHLMLDTLIGSNQNYSRAVDGLRKEDELCLIGPAALYQSGQHLMYDNEHNLSRILAACYHDKLPEVDWGFFAGTMFWARVETLLPLSKHVTYGHPGIGGEYKKDGKIEHALERFFGLIPRLRKGKVGLLQPKSGRHDDCEVVIHDSFTSIGQAHIGDVMRQLVRTSTEIDKIKESGHFDSKYYLSQCPELSGNDVDLVYHYMLQGVFNGKLPCPTFTIWNEIKAYLREIGDERNPFIFFIEHHGDVVEITNYINARFKRAKIFDKNIISATELFDIEYYYKQCPKLRTTGEDPLDHYLREGVSNELYPNRYFIPREYRTLHKDVADSGTEPFFHYIKSGAIEGRRYRCTESREKTETPYFRYMVLNSVLINWKTQQTLNRSKDLVSIIIPIYGQTELTKSCLDSLINVRTKADFEVICVDNGSEESIKTLLKQFSQSDKRIKVITNRENYNFALGCNLGFANSKGARVIFLNNDTTVTDYWLDELVSPLVESRVAAVQPKLLYPDQRVQNVGVVFAPNQTLGYPIYADFNSDEECVSYKRDYQAITAACLAVRAVDFARVKGFDPLFINGQEDIDFCLRLTSGSDRVCRYHADSVVIHHESKTPGRGTFIALNRKNFTERWKEKIKADDFKYYSEDKYRITEYVKDNQDFTGMGIGIFRPVLEKMKIHNILYRWDSIRESNLTKMVDQLYSKNISLYKDKLVSIIMPTFNRGHIISKAIDSVMQQTHANYELLICDDGSNDNTEEIVSKYTWDQRIKYCKVNHVGVSGARNKGLDQAKGDVITYLDSDNTWNIDFLKKIIVVMDQGKLDAAYSSIKVLNDLEETVCYRGDSFDWNECLKENYIDMNAFSHIGVNDSGRGLRFDESLKRLVDWDFILRITKNAKVCHIPYLGVNYYDGEHYERITRTEYLGDKLAAMQDAIRQKHRSEEGKYDRSTNPDLIAEALLSSGPPDKKQHSLDASLILQQRKALNFRIKIGCPNLLVSHEWGDYHFAMAMKRSIEKLNHRCVVDCLDTWNVPDSRQADVVIVLRGLSRYTPKEGQINLMWNISHPDKIDIDEYSEYDHVFVASTPYSKKLQKQSSVPVSALLQCTDPELFKPVAELKHHHQVLFVGNSRNVYRKIVKDAVQVDLPLTVYGTRWEQFIPKKYLGGDHVRNEELADYYASAGVVLNDHWDTMREYGFLSNRLFDAAACAATVVSDEIEGLHSIFDNGILTYNSPEQLKEICRLAPAQNTISQRLALAEKIRTEHSFDSRIKLIMTVANELITNK